MSTPPAPSPSLAANPLPGEWVDFGMDGIVTIRPGKVEYGQGVWTALAQIAAEELDVGLDQVRVAGVSTSSSPNEGVTSGSRSIQDCGGALRQVCAQVRAAFLAEAAEKLGTDPAGLEVRRGVARAGAGEAGLGYWSLDEAALLGRAARLPAAAKPPSQWSVAGRSAPRIDLPDKVDRTAPVPARPGAAGHAVRPGDPAPGASGRAGRDGPGGPARRGGGTGPGRLVSRRDRRVRPDRGDRGGAAGAGRPLDGAGVAAGRGRPEGLPAVPAHRGPAGGAAPRPGGGCPGQPGLRRGVHQAVHRARLDGPQLRHRPLG